MFVVEYWSPLAFRVFEIESKATDQNTLIIYSP